MQYNVSQDYKSRPSPMYKFLEATSSPSPELLSSSHKASFYTVNNNEEKGWCENLVIQDETLVEISSTTMWCCLIPQNCIVKWLLWYILHWFCIF